MSAQAELHDLIRSMLKADATVMALITEIYDAIPNKNWKAPEAYISFGPTDVTDDDAECIVGGIFTVQLDCWSREVGSYYCKRIVDAVKEALHDVDAELTTYGLVDMRVTSRRVLADPDGKTMHGIVVVQAMIEEEVEDA